MNTLPHPAKPSITIICCSLALASMTLPCPAASAESEPQIVRPSSEHQDSVRRFQGIPSIAVTAGKRIWATWYGGGIDEGPENYVMLATSGDDSKTWSDLKLVVDPPFRASEPAVWLDPSGKLWWMWNQYPNGLRHRGGKLWAITTDNPESADPSWTRPRVIAEELHNFNKPTVLKDLSWIWPTGSWSDKISSPILSHDQGKTFAPAGEFVVPEDAREFDEYQVVQKKDGRLWLLTRTRKGIGECFSTDGGKTWSALQPSKIQHTVSRFFITRLQSGNLLLVKHGPINENVGRAKLMAFVSSDDGETWNGGLMLDERDGVSYPDGTQTADGQIYIIYDRDRAKDKEILMATFTEHDVREAAPVSQRTRFKVLVNKASGINPRVVTSKWISGSSPELTPERAKIEDLAEGKPVFRNRSYTWKAFPRPLAGKHYLLADIEGCEFSVIKDGVLYVATPVSSRNRDSQEHELLGQGFTRSDIEEFSAFDFPEKENGTLCSIFQKEVKAGETIRVSKWGVVIF